MNDTAKHRINLVLSMDNPMQKKACGVLTEYPPGSRTSAICQALCEYRQQAVVENIRQLLQQELRNITLQSMPQIPAKPAPLKENPAVLDFIQKLQAE